MNTFLQVFDPANIGAFFTQFQVDMQQPTFWLAVGKIIWINVLLSGDNALVIAMACRGLHGGHRIWGMVIGAGIAVVLLIAFTGIVATLMSLPYLKLVGGILLLIIAAKLLVPEDENDEVAAGTTLWHAVRIVVIADIIMSLDNVIAVAAAANGQMSLLVLGLAISIPDDHRGRGADHVRAGSLPGADLARRHAARLDRGRRDRQRPDRPVAVPCDDRRSHHHRRDLEDPRRLPLQPGRRPDGYRGLRPRLGRGPGRRNHLAPAQDRSESMRELKEAQHRAVPAAWCAAQKFALRRFATNSHPDRSGELRYRVTARRAAARRLALNFLSDLLDPGSARSSRSSAPRSPTPSSG